MDGLDHRPRGTPLAWRHPGQPLTYPGFPGGVRLAPPSSPAAGDEGEGLLRFTRGYSHSSPFGDEGEASRTPPGNPGYVRDSPSLLEIGEAGPDTDTADAWGGAAFQTGECFAFPGRGAARVYLKADRHEQTPESVGRGLWSPDGWAADGMRVRRNDHPVHHPVDAVGQLLDLSVAEA